MSEYHSLLKRQLRRLLADHEPPADWADLLLQVDTAYKQFDRDRAMIERSMEISSIELQQANADIRAVLEGLVDYYLRLNETGTILYGRGLATPAILTPAPSMTGRNIRDVIVPSYKTLFDDKLSYMHKSGEITVFECDTEQSDQGHHYEVWFVPAHNSQVSVIIRDITASKNADLREQKLQNRLSRAERMESLGLLAGGVAHDLNNILSPLVSYPDLLIETMSPEDPRRDMVIQMQKSVMRASAIIQDLLTLTRRGNNQSEQVDINHALNQYLQSADFNELKKTHPDIDFDIHLEDELPALRGSSSQLTQTIMNLVTNAVEAIGSKTPGSVRVSATLSASGGESDGVAGEHLLLTVEDTGCGIPADEIDHIFEPFFSRRKHERSGTGLGLAIVYGTVNDFGGTIHVESETGKGARFIIRLPLDPQRNEHRENHHTSTTVNGTPCSVLVVDDDENQRKLCEAILTSRDYTVSTAINGREAVAWLKLNDVDIVLLDMIMEEDCDGLRTYEAILTFKPHQKCIIVSGYAKTENVQRALELGVHSFVQKPYTLKILQSAIEAALASDPAYEI